MILEKFNLVTKILNHLKYFSKKMSETDLTNKRI